MAITLVSVPVGFSARPDAGYSMRRAQKRAGTTQKINSGYRSTTAQHTLFVNNYTRNYVTSAKFDRKWYAGSFWWRRKGDTVNVAVPGTSMHNKGLAFDVSTSSELQDTLLASPSHGFRRTLKSEPWHWEYDVTLDKWRTAIRSMQAALSIGTSERWGTGTDKAVLALREAAYKGNYGHTDAEQRYLQRRVDVTDDGRIGPKTKAAVKAHTKQVQALMRALNLYHGTLDGDWGSGTETAFRTYRRIGYTP